MTRLPEDLDATVFIVLHMDPKCRSALPEILLLQRETSLIVKRARDREPFALREIWALNCVALAF